MTRNHRDTAEWKRIRAQIGPHSTEIDPDEHADFVYGITRRQKWNVEEELAAELHDTVSAERNKPRNKPRGRNGKRKAKDNG